MKTHCGVVAVSRSCLVAMLAVLLVFQAPPSTLGADGVVTLRSGTPVFLVVMRSIYSDSVKEGDHVPVQVRRAVRVGRVVVIRAGARANAVVTEAKKAKGWGKRGTIAFRINSVIATDTQEIALSAKQQRQGESKRGAAIALGVGAGILCFPAVLLGFAVKGEDGEVPAGYEIKAYVETDYEINLNDRGISSLTEELERRRRLEQQVIEQRQREAEENKKRDEEKRVDPNLPRRR